MKTLTQKILASLVLFLVLATTISTAQAACLSPLEAQKAAESGEIRSFDQVLAQAGIDDSVKILSRQVCDEGGRLVYIVGIFKDGQAQNLVLDAQ
ncbi:putative membrane protein YkoI [Devosia sp. UYZn731]|uniref:hypothetical protein n=1 Tax=Devosia sp. UYZn731 TaxID=3156345 RepID=UPI00339744E5